MSGMNVAATAALLRSCGCTAVASAALSVTLEVGMDGFR